MKTTKLLSRREEEVIALLLQGKSNKQIAAALHISERTVEFHLKNIYAKFNVNSRVELILTLGKSAGNFSDNPVESTVDGEENTDHNGKQNEPENGWEQFLKKIAPKNQKEFAMDTKFRTILTVIIALVGIILIVGGIITDKNGAVVGGLIVASVAVRQLISSRKKPNQGDK